MTVLPEVVATTTRQHADEKRQEVAQTHDEYGQNDAWSNNQEPVGVEEDWNPNQKVLIITRISSRISYCWIMFI